MAKLITPQAYSDAREFVFDCARRLERARFRFRFESGSADDVLRELAAYQNEDGGFGHGLEPDARTAASTAVATESAFAVLREVGTPSDHPIVTRAVAFLLRTYDRDRRIWEIVPPQVESAPHAPWWTYDSIMTTFRGCELNPFAALAGALLEHPSLVPAPLLDETAAVLLERVRARAGSISADELRDLVRLAESEQLTVRAQVRSLIAATVGSVVEADPARWSEYRLQPLEVLHSPDSFLAGALDPALVQRNLDYWVEQQSPDGSWPLTWSWAEVDAHAWAHAEVEWRGVQVVERLAILRAHGRLAPLR